MERVLWSWIEQFAAESDPRKCVGAFRGLAAKYGVSGFAAGEVDLERRERCAFHVVEWPERWLKFYLGGSVNRDPVVSALPRRRAPFSWKDLRDDPDFDGADRQSLNLANAAGWEDGFAIPIPRGGARYGLVSLLRERGTFSIEEKALLALIGVYFYERLRGLTTAKAFASAPSSIPPRAIECLTFSAHGMSDREVGEKLGISQSTAREYVEVVKRRLGARTRTEAAAVATSLGLINP